jgi:hypothetical protein
MLRADERYARLNDRLCQAQGALLCLFPLLVVAQPLLFGAHVAVLAVHALCFVLALATVRVIGPRDATLAFIAIHPFWFFSFALYLYALLHGKSAERDLYAPLLSATLELVALAASLVALGLVNRLRRFGLFPAPRAPLDRRMLRRFAISLMVFAAPFSVVSVLDPANHFLNAVTGLANPLVYVSVICLCAAQGSGWFRSPLLWAIIAAQVAFAVLVNGRGFYLAIGLTIAVVYLAQESRLITFGRLAVAYVAVRAMNALSYVMLAGRLEVGHEGSVALVTRALISQDFYLAVLGFDTLRDATAFVDSDVMRHDLYQLDMFEGHRGLAERLTQLPFMDIIVANLPRKLPVDWYDIANALLSVMPALGQAKDPDLFDDRLAWQTGLMLPDTAGHPLVTAIGEFYAMGGVLALFVLFGMNMMLVFVFYFLTQRLFGDRYLAAATLLVSSIYLVFSSTATSALAVPLRIYPVIVAAYLLFGQIAQVAGGSGRAQAA